MGKKLTWARDFAPCYTPMEMIEAGVFEGIYTGCIKGIPDKYKRNSKVLKCGSDPDISINKYGIKSRLSLSEWKKNGWTTKDSPLGWWEWYIKYFEGRRLDEDKWQINRWKSFVARHQGQTDASCRGKGDDCHRKQRQALLQWAWNSDKSFTDKQKEKNIEKMLKETGCVLEEISQESLVVFSSLRVTE